MRLWDRLVHGDVYAAHARSLAAVVDVLSASEPRSWRYSVGSIAASIVPAAPGSAAANIVTYTDPAQLAADLGGVAGVYRLHGIHRWSVWVPEDHRRAAAAATARGLRKAEEVVAMTLDLRAWRVPALVADDQGDMRTLGRVAGEVFGDGLEAAFVGRADEIGHTTRVYRGLVDGAVASVVLAIHHANRRHCTLAFAATLEPARGRGLATQGIAAAAAGAAEHGYVTALLQASAAGRAIYERLGFRGWFSYHRYEGYEGGSDA